MSLEHRETKSKEPNPKKRLLFAARKSPKNAKNLFDATPYAATTSDPIRAKNKNITGFGPRDLIDFDSWWDRFLTCQSWGGFRHVFVGRISNLSKSISHLQGGTFARGFHSASRTFASAVTIALSVNRKKHSGKTPCRNPP
jgi:hypothetical protein